MRDTIEKQHAEWIVKSSLRIFGEESTEDTYQKRARKKEKTWWKVRFECGFLEKKK